MLQWVTVGTFDNYLEAHIVKGLLESEDVPVFLVGEHFLISQKMFNVALADIRLQVPSELVSIAKELLMQYQQGYFQAPLEVEFKLPTTICQNCGSHDTQEIPAIYSLITIILIAYFFIGRVIPPKKYKICKKCKSKIQED